MDDADSNHDHHLAVGTSGNSHLGNFAAAAAGRSGALVAAFSRSFSHTKLTDDVHEASANSTNFAAVVASLPPMPPPPLESSANGTTAKLPSAMKRTVSQKSSLHTPTLDNRMERVRSLRNDPQVSSFDRRAPESHR
ncbi:hypothetical protein HDU84_000438, partial [Entophlyctis sp. JEL0112]